MSPVRWLALLLVLMPASAQQSGWEHQFGGYYKALFRASRSFFTNDPYGDLMNRLRLSWDARHGEWFQAHVDLDNQAHFGNLNTQPEFELVRTRQAGTWWDLHRINTNRDHAYWDTSLYRGYVTLRHQGA
ncbi:MAG: hypothetical protein GY953_50355, partial [bacterium]|nr:hypothetical protein [bacterium]